MTIGGSKVFWVECADPNPPVPGSAANPFTLGPGASQIIVMAFVNDTLPDARYSVVLSADQPDDFVIGTGETHSVREFCEAAFAEVGIELEWQGRGDAEVGHERGSGTVRVAVDPKYYRPAEVDELQADATKARTTLGWVPTVTFAELVRMMVRHDLAEVKRS